MSIKAEKIKTEITSKEVSLLKGFPYKVLIIAFYIVRVFAMFKEELSFILFNTKEEII